MSDKELAKQTEIFKKKSENLDAILPEVFAVAREASKRVLGMRPYDVQLIGGMVLNMGAVAEMKTGEGKMEWPSLSFPRDVSRCNCKRGFIHL